MISFGIAAAIFCGAIAIGVYSGTWNTLGNVDPATITNIIGSTGATSVSHYELGGSVYGMRIPVIFYV